MKAMLYLFRFNLNTNTTHKTHPINKIGCSKSEESDTFSHEIERKKKNMRTRLDMNGLTLFYRRQCTCIKLYSRFSSNSEADASELLEYLE